MRAEVGIGSARFTRLFLGFIVAVLSACGAVTGPVETAAPQIVNGTVPKTPTVIDPELEKYRAIWEEKKLSDYDMVLRFDQGNGIGGPASPVLIQVRGGRAITIAATREIDPRRTDDYLKFETVEKMFEEIQNLTDKEAASLKDPDRTRAGLPRVEVKYDTELGFPKEIFTSFSSTATDSWAILRIEKFTAVTTESK